ncbi:MAG: patatin-like phospholipase family protein [Gammaproteobacteria bacterium]|nr:patatin-like phospholipase family protein [Gammaproteobacteria bacterium]
MNKKTKISLVLGSGAARGLAHIGVIRCLEDRGFEIQYISGSSMGALIGGIYAAGELGAYVEWVSALKRRNIIRLLDLSFSRKSIFKGEKIIEVLNGMIGDRNIENLSIGFTAVATDINEQKEIWLTQGSLFEAIRASIAVPTIFSPVKLSGRVLIDGGIINPVPIAPTLNDDTELTIAVVLNGPPEVFKDDQEEELNNDGEKEATNKYQLRIEKFIEGLLPKGGADKNKEDLGIFNLVTQSMDTMQSSIARFQLAAYRPDIVIEIPRNICSWFDFDRAQDLIEFGYIRTEEALIRYNEMLERRK